MRGSFRVFVTEEFEKRFNELPSHIQKKAEKQESLFRQNPFYPSLNTEKLAPHEKDVWSFRIDQEYRIAFRFYGAGKVILLTVGTHDWIYKIIHRYFL